MKLVVFLAVAVTVVASIPQLYERYHTRYSVAKIPPLYERYHTRYSVIEPNFPDDPDLAKISGKIGISIKTEDGIWKRILRFGDGAKDNKKKDDREESKLASVPAAIPAKIHGTINVQLKFSNPAAMEDDTQLAMGTDWIQIDKEKDVIEINGCIRLRDEKIREIVDKLYDDLLNEYGKTLGTNYINEIEYIEPIQVEDIEVLPPPEYEGKNLADIPETELAKFKFRIKGDIKINIKFLNPDAMEESQPSLPENLESSPQKASNTDVPLDEEAMPSKFRLKISGNINIKFTFSNLDGIENAYGMGNILDIHVAEVESFKVGEVSIA